MATPLRRPTSGISSRNADGPGERRLLRSRNTNRDNLGRSDVDRGQGLEIQRSLYRGKSSPKLDDNRYEPKHVLWQRSHPKEKLSLPGPIQKSDRSTTHRDGRKTDVSLRGPWRFTAIRRSHDGTLLVGLKPETPEWKRLCTDVFEEEASDDMQTYRTIPVEDTGPDQMDTVEDDILSDQMDTSDDNMQSDQTHSLEVESLARGEEDMEGGGRPSKSRKVETRMSNLQIESCLKDYPATCAAPTSYRPAWEPGPARLSSIRTRATVAEVTGWRFTFATWDPRNFPIRWETHLKRITALSPTS
jgi:hypothetical protein